MDTAAWWSAYFDPREALDDEQRWPITNDTSIGVVCAGTERRVVVEHEGARTVFGDREAVIAWDLLVVIAAAAQVRRSHCLVALQRFAWIDIPDVPAANRQLRAAHESISVVEDVGPFVDRTLVYTNGAPRPAPEPIAQVLHAATHATPQAAYDLEYDLGADKLREARRFGTGATGRAAVLRDAVERFFAASEVPVDADQRAEALCYSGAMLVELAQELKLDEAMQTLELAASRLELVTRIDPNNLDGRRRAADAYHHMGDRICDDDPTRGARLYAQCAQHARELLAATPPEAHPPTLDILIGAEVMIEDCLRRAGQDADAKEALVRAVEATEQLARPTMNSACAYAAAGHIEDAFRLLEVAVFADKLTAEDLLTNDVFDALHRDPRWKALLARL